MMKLCEVAARLNVSTRTVRRLVVRDLLRARSVSKRCMRFLRADVEEYIAHA